MKQLTNKLKWTGMGMFFLSMPFHPDEFQHVRSRMVAEQIEARGVADEAVLDAMRKVPRHLFVPEEYRRFAYSDRPVPIGNGQTISQPYIVALMTALLELRATDRVLEIGTGSGYQAAILGEIAEQVYTVEIVEELGREAADRLNALRYANVHVKVGDGYAGWEDFAPYDAVIVTAAVDTVPQPLVDQLKEGGRLVVPVGAPSSVQKLKLLEKKEDKIITRTVARVRFVPFVHD